MDEPRKTVTVTIPLEQLAGLSARIAAMPQEAIDSALKQEAERLRERSRAELARLSLLYNASVDTTQPNC